MSELYNTGVNRVVYRAEAFGAGKTVTAYFWDPSLVKSELQTFTEVELGLYYLDYDFTATGTYIGLFYENDVAKANGIFRVSTEIVTALFAKTGITADGTVSYEDLIKALYAMARGKISKSGDAYTFYDDDNATELFTLTISESSRTTS